MSRQTVLIVDDDAGICDLISGAASAMGLRPVATLRADKFLALLTPDVRIVFIDLLLPETDGIEVLRALGDAQSRVPIVIISGIGGRVLESAKSMAAALNLNIVGYLKKPFRIAQIEGFIRSKPNHRKISTQVGAAANVFSADELRAALRDQQLVLHFQPQIEIATRNVVGIEALVRWNHPSRGLVYPDLFIPLAEKYELIDELGWQVMKLALLSLPELASPGGELPTISVNVTATSLLDLQFLEKLTELLTASSIPPDRVVLEITETGLIGNMSTTLDVLLRLRLRGVRLSVDDFGTGYSMMKQLKNLPATELKIDQSFVNSMSDNLSDLVMVRKTIEIGHELGMVVVAEGVETNEHFTMLRDDHCDIAQGYLFTRPLPSKALRSWLSRYRSQVSTSKQQDIPPG
jgi:EAL domain-containing protein (putative c-di-GMP-specific phosphodiesterase class I)